jgi:apolipoprotein N-acyltransferase
MHTLIITGFDWTRLGYAFATVVGVGFVTLSATTAMFKRAVAG